MCKVHAFCVLDGKCIYGRNLGTQTNLGNNLTFSPNGGDYTGIYPDHYYPFMSPHYHTNGFYNKQRYLFFYLMHLFLSYIFNIYFKILHKQT